MRRVKRASFVRSCHKRGGPEEDEVPAQTAGPPPVAGNFAKDPPPARVQGDGDCIVIMSTDGRYWTGEGWTPDLADALRLPALDPGLKVSRPVAREAKSRSGVDCLICYIVAPVPTRPAPGPRVGLSFWRR
jgi:hypothetical protein